VSTVTDDHSKHSIGHNPAEWQRVYREVCGLLVAHLGLTLASLSPDSRLDEDLFLDSLDLVDLGMVLNDTLHVDLGVDVLRLAHTLGELTSLVTAALDVDRSEEDEC